MDKKPKRPRDINQLAKMMIDIASGETVAPQKVHGNKKDVGGKKGGIARSLKLTDVQRTEIARVAAQARWKKS
jgi:hypothetical protein